MKIGKYSNSIKIISFGFIIIFQLSGQDLDSDTCADCHDDVIIDQSVHAELDCLECHEKVLEIGLDHAQKYVSNCEDVCESCGSCHADAEEQYKFSLYLNRINVS